MSLMVANVRDRVTEIGLRRALGATRNDISFMFIYEAFLISGTAAVMGIVVTHLLLLLFKNAIPVPLKMGITSMFLPFAAAVILSICFSYWPAKLAARIEPAEALRYE
jgi:ABC-type antimicrobial peptide transport system permease subunit